MKKFELSSSVGEEDIDLHNEIESLRIVEDNYDKGIWQRKIATHWEEIQELAIKGLKQSRDLMLAARLIEATCYIENLEGVLEAIKTFKDISQGEYYPLDDDFRERIQIWFDQKLPLICFFNSGFFSINQKKHSSKVEIKSQLLNILEILKTINFTTENFQNHINKILETIENVEHTKSNISHLTLEETDKLKISQIISRNR